MKLREAGGTPHRLGVRRVMRAGAVALAIALLLTPVRAAAQTAGTVVVAGQVVELTSPVDVGSSRPLPTWVTGYDAVANVDGVGFDQTVSDATRTYAAVPGGQLLFLSIGVSSFPPALQNSFAGLAAPTLAVTVGSHTYGLPIQASSDGSGYQGEWAVGVPGGDPPAVLSLTSYGYTQRLDLRTGRHVGATPQVLYRSVDPSKLQTTLDRTETYTAASAAGPIGFPIAVGTVALTFFDPTTHNVEHLADNQALLAVQVAAMNGTTSDGGTAQLEPGHPIPVAVAIGAGPTLNPTELLPVGLIPEGPSTQVGLVDGIYEFVVPAELTAAQVVVGPPTGATAQITNPDGTTSDAAVTFTGGAQFAISFPAPLAVQPAENTAVAAGPTTTTVPAATTDPAPSTTTAVAGPPGATGANGVPVANGVPGTRDSGDGGRVVALAPSTGGGGVGGVPLIAGLAGSSGVVVIVGLLVWERKTRYAPASPVTPGVDAVLDPIPAETPPTETTAVGVFPGVPPPPRVDQEPFQVAAGTPLRPGGEQTEPLLVVRLLGPLQVEGLKATLRHRPPLRVLILLALSEGAGLSGDQLRNRLAVEEDGEVSGSSLRAYVSRLRAVLPDGVLPDMTAAIYRLNPALVTVDLDQYRQLMTRAKALNGVDRLDLAVRALSLIRGPVLDGGTWHGVERTVGIVEIGIEDDATATVALARQLGRVDIAGRAARQATMGCPQVASLWELRLEAAAAGSGEGLSGVWGQIGVDVKAANPQLEALYRRLRGDLS